MAPVIQVGIDQLFSTLLAIALLVVGGTRFSGVVAGAALVLAQFGVSLMWWWLARPQAEKERSFTGLWLVLSVIIFVFLAVCDFFTYEYAYVSDFSGDFDLSNWTHENDPESVGGSYNTNPGPPLELFVVGGDADIRGYSNFTIDIPEAGVIRFDWGYQSDDTGCWDSGGVILNGVYEALACNGESTPFFEQSHAVAVNAGDIFGFSVLTEDGTAGAGVLRLTNFVFEPAADAGAAAVVGGRAWRSRRRLAGTVLAQRELFLPRMHPLPRELGQQRHFSLVVC